MNDKSAAAVPFARAAGLLADLAGVRLTARRVGRSAEASGAAQDGASRGRARLIAGRRLVPLPPQPVPDKLYGGCFVHAAGEVLRGPRRHRWLSASSW